MRQLKLLPTPGLKISKKGLEGVYARIYERTVKQLGTVERQDLLSDKRKMRKMVDGYVRDIMREYGFALV